MDLRIEPFAHGAVVVGQGPDAGGKFGVEHTMEDLLLGAARVPSQAGP